MSIEQNSYVGPFARLVKDVFEKIETFVGEDECWIDPYELEINMWNQTWGDTTHGWGGMGGQMISSAPCWMLYSRAINLAFVYHGKFAYAVLNPGDGFWAKVQQKDLPTRASHKTFASRADREDQNRIIHNFDKKPVSTFEIVSGDIFASGMQTLTNPVNCAGAMGKGLALEFKKRYPAMCNDYRMRCGRGQVRIGEPYVYKEKFGPRILNFPTKEHWRNPTELVWIKRGLEYLTLHYQEMGITSLAVPALGCGLGELDWESVKPFLVEYLSPLPIPVKVYEPK